MTEQLQRGRKYLLVIGVQSEIFNGVSNQVVATASSSPSSIVIDELNIEFQITKCRDNKKSSNQATIGVWNLSEGTRAFLQTGKLVNVTLYAGYEYEGGMDVLVQGNVTLVSSKKDGEVIVTTLTVNENFVALNNTSVTSTIPDGKTIEDVIEEVRKKMSLNSVAQGGPLITKGLYEGTNKNSKVLYGYSITGAAKQVLDEIGMAYGIEWSLNNGSLNIKDEGNLTKKDQTRTYILSKDTGLIDIPTLSQKSVTVKLPKPIDVITKNSNGKTVKRKKKTATVDVKGISFKALLNPFLRPGDLVKIESEVTKQYIDTYYQIYNIKYYGEYRGNDWYIEAFCNEVELIL